MDIELYKKEIIPRLRRKHIKPPETMIREVMEAYLFEEKEPEYYQENASEFKTMRTILWKDFRDAERKFNSAATAELLNNESLIRDLTSLLHNTSLTDEEKLEQIIGKYSYENEEHLFELNKSNTNSRRSRAGIEFEELFKRILIKSDISFDDQGAVGKKNFDAAVSKLVDFVIPGVEEYRLNKPQCALVSMKTTLRERWQEVPEELARTGAHFMYLLTLESDVSDEIIEILHNNRIYLVLLDEYKNAKYSLDTRVYGLTTLISDLQRICFYWNSAAAEKLLKQDAIITNKITLYEKRFREAKAGYEKDFYQKRLEYFKSY